MKFGRRRKDLAAEVADLFRQLEATDFRAVSLGMRAETDRRLVAASRAWLQAFEALDRA